MKRTIMSAACAAALCITTGAAVAQTKIDYPKRPVRFIISQTPGGNADFVGRIIAESLGKRLGQQFVVDNRAGASGIIAAELAAKSPPDGHTLLLVVTSYVVNPGLYKKLPFDPLKDFAPITQIAYAPQILVISPTLKVQSVKDLIALARSRPGELNYGVSSIGGATQLAAELFNLMAKTKMTLIPYKGAPAVLVDLMAGRIDLSFSTMPSAMPHVRSGKLRGIAITGSKRSPAVPDLPTIAEAALPGYEMVAWQGLIAPRGTPAPVIQLINREIATIVQQPEVRKQLSGEGGEPVANSPEEFGRWLATEIEKWRRVVEAANIQPQ
jgi:tripartite-type tricarboxylate transporter receptor subunit TctC